MSFRRRPRRHVSRDLVWGACVSVPLLLLATQAAHAFELEPDEYVAAPPGTTALFQYFFYAGDQSYHPVGGTTVRLDTHLTETVGLTRATQFFQLGPLEALAEVLQPYGALGNASIGGTSYQDSTGAGDTTVAVALWPYKNAAKQTYVGIATYITLPDGAYNATHAINLGGHRVVYDPELAFHQGFGNHWSVDLTGDYILYGNNSYGNGTGQATVSQHPTVQMQAFVNYAVGKFVDISLGYEGESGGRQFLNGADTAAKTEFQEIRFVASYSVTSSFQVLGEVNHQFQNVGGFKEAVGVTMRALYTF